MKHMMIGVIAALLFSSCNVKENKELKAKVDSLSTELVASQKAAATLNEVGIMLDSIESSRLVLRSGVVEGTGYADYAGRMRNLNDYVKMTQNKIEELEASLIKTKNSSSVYAAMVQKLKGELESSTQQIAALQSEVERYRTENQTLYGTVVKKDSLLATNAEMIKVKEQDIATLEIKVQNVTTASIVTKADLLYEQGVALELAASRTKLAPRKKKETQREALELYKQSFSLGKQEAKDKIELLEKALS